MEKKKNHVLLILFGVFAIAIGSIFAYRFTQKEPEKQVLDAKEKLVSDALTMLNKGGGCTNTIYDYKTGEVTADTMKESIKWMMSYTNLPKSELKQTACSQLTPSQLFTAEELRYSVACGTSEVENGKFVTEVGGTGTTLFIREDAIKVEWEKIFGPGTYKRVATITDSNRRLTYIDSLKGYVEGILPVGGACAAVKDTVLSSFKQGDAVVITSEVVFEVPMAGTTTTKYQYVYTFEKNKTDNKYYFTKLDKAAKN